MIGILKVTFPSKGNTSSSLGNISVRFFLIVVIDINHTSETTRPWAHSHSTDREVFLLFFLFCFACVNLFLLNDQSISSINVL